MGGANRQNGYMLDANQPGMNDAYSDQVEVDREGDSTHGSIVTGTLSSSVALIFLLLPHYQIST